MALTSEQYQLPPSSVAPDAQRSARATVKVAATTMPEAMNRIMVGCARNKGVSERQKCTAAVRQIKRVKGKQGVYMACVAREQQ